MKGKHFRGVGNRAVEAARRESGFTIVEMALVVILLGVALGVITMSYGSARKNMALTGASREIKALIQRAFNITAQEGVDVYLAFWDVNGDDDGEHPHRAAIYRVLPSGVNEWEDDTPTEPPPPGLSAESDGSGHYWYELADGQASIQSTAVFLFRRLGSLVDVSPVEGDMSVTAVVDGRTVTLLVNDRGEIRE